MPQCQFLFSAVFGSRKAVRAIFSEFDKTKTQHHNSPRQTRTPKESRRGGLGPPDHRSAWPRGGGAPPYGVGPSGAPPTLPLRETIFLFRHILCALLGASVCFYFRFFYFHFLNKCLCGRETRSAGSYEHMCS